MPVIDKVLRTTGLRPGSGRQSPGAPAAVPPGDDLYAGRGNHGSVVDEQALKFIWEFYDVEREVANLDFAGRVEGRRRQFRQVADAPHQRLRPQRQEVPDGSKRPGAPS